MGRGSPTAATARRQVGRVRTESRRRGLDAMATRRSDNACEDVSLGAKPNKINTFFSATGLERESSTRSNAAGSSRRTSGPIEDSGSGEPSVLGQPRPARNPNVGAILRRALVMLRRRGWRSTHWERGGSGLSISEAIQRAGRADADCYYAKLTLNAVLGSPFSDWEAGMWRSQEEVFALLRRAAVVARGDAFAAHAGGWRVSMGRAERAAPNVQPMQQRRAKR